MSQLYNDYSTFDQRRKLTFLFDKFLVDKKIATRVNGFMGTKLMQDGRAAFPVDLTLANLAQEIDANLRNVFYQYPFLDYHKPNIKIGRHQMDDAKIVDNIIDVVRQLGTMHPGGSQNIWKIHIKPNVYVADTVDLYTNTGMYLFKNKYIANSMDSLTPSM